MTKLDGGNNETARRTGIASECPSTCQCQGNPGAEGNAFATILAATATDEAARPTRRIETSPVIAVPLVAEVLAECARDGRPAYDMPARDTAHRAYAKRSLPDAGIKVERSGDALVITMKARVAK